MKFFISFAFGARSVLGIALTLFATCRPVVQASCQDEFHKDCDEGWSRGLHHITRRSVSSTVSKSLKVDFAPVVQNVTYYNTGDEIKFNLNLTHNQSAVADITSSLNVMISSQFLEPKTSSLSGATGLISNQDLNSSALSFSIASLDQNEVVNVSFVGIVKSTIHPLAGLYFVVHVTGTNGSSTDYHYGPVPSLPTLYAVFPRVSLRRASYEDLWVGNTTSYTMTIIMPRLNFSLLVEISTAINEFSFMEVKEVLVTSVGQNINVGTGGGTKSPQPQYDAGQEVPFNDRAVLDFGNLTVTGNDESKNKIVIHYNVTIRDHPLLANNTKHWVGAGMRSGYQMLWVGQEAVYIYKSEPSVCAEITAVNDTTNKRYVIGDELHVSWTVSHSKNTSYEDAQNVGITFHSNTLNFLSGTYEEPAGGGEKALTFKDSFHSNTVTISRLAKGNSIYGNLVLNVSENISPLQTLDVFLQLSYQNTRGDDKLNTTHKVSYVAGVPVFSLELNSTTNQIRIGGRAKFFFSIIMRKMVSTLEVEVILPVNESSIMSVTAFRVVSVGSKIENHRALNTARPQLSSTVGDPKLHDRATIDFGTVKSVTAVGTEADHKILMEFEIIVNDHSNVTNGSKQWVGVGVRGGKRMMWICEVALIADVPTDRRPVLQVSGTCALPGSQMSCSNATTLKRSSKVYFNGTVYHDQRSQQYADNVNVLWMIPPYVTFSKLHNDPGLMYQTTDSGPKFSFNQKLHFLDRLSFSVEGKLDPNGIMPPGDTYAVSPIQLTYSPHSMSAVYTAPLAPVSFKFNSLGDVTPEQVVEEVQDVYSRGFLLDPTRNTVYICQKSNDRSLSSCFSTSDDGASWMAIDQHVCYIIGQDGADLYGVACNKRAYMRRRKSNHAWYAVDEETWEDAKKRNADIQKNLRTIPDDYSNSSDHPTDKVVGSASQWGATMKGVFLNKAGWKLKAQWKCCGN